MSYRFKVAGRSVITYRLYLLVLKGKLKNIFKVLNLCPLWPIEFCYFTTMYSFLTANKFSKVLTPSLPTHEYKRCATSTTTASTSGESTLPRALKRGRTPALSLLYMAPLDRKTNGRPFGSYLEFTNLNFEKFKRVKCW